jgi:molybdate/tungstate transport system substrate-binding protein
MRRTFAQVAIALALAACVTLSGCAPSSPAAVARTKILVLFAGSLMLPLQEVERQFEVANPDIDVELEGHGSIQAIRQVSDIHRQADVVISADKALIPMLMYASKDPETGKPYASWQIEFATNEMCLAYSPTSKHAGEITSDNWYDIIRRPGVRLGFSDPRFDANGYRALMVLKMAERHYDQPTLFFDVMSGQLADPIGVSTEGTVEVLSVPEIVETVQGATVMVRMNSVQLLPLVQSGDLDYAFEYVSVTKQHGLKYVELPPELNLGSEALNPDYAGVRVDVALQNYKSVVPRFEGASVIYGATIPSNSANTAGAERFLAFLLGPKGRAILNEFDHPVLAPARASDPALVPQPLRSLLAGGADAAPARSGADE